MLPIPQRPSDAPDFIARVEAVVARALQARPAHLILIRVDNWFGERWIGFGGKVLGLAGISFKDNLVLPPFVPSRIVEGADEARGSHPKGVSACVRITACLTAARRSS